jgi:hypothetical protein
MANFRLSILILLLLTSASRCKFSDNSSDKAEDMKEESLPYQEQMAMGKLENKDLKEASGIVASHSFPGYFWSHNDSGGKALLFLIDSLGGGKLEFKIEGAKNRDWEDISIFKDSSTQKSTIVIGDIGDNSTKHDNCTLLFVEEPNTFPFEDQSLTVYKKVVFEYPDGARDAEALMIDPITKDIFIVSKKERKVSMYRIPYPHVESETLTAEKVLTLPIRNITAGDIAPDGSAILLKNYDAIYYYTREATESIVDAMRKTPLKLAYTREPQGEAICFAQDSKAFYTLSEKSSKNKHPVLYKYIKKED